MKRAKVVLSLPVVVLAVVSWGAASAQRTLPTASQSLQLSAFGGLSGVYTGLSSGRNLSITAGADLGLRPYGGVRPTIEVRGTYPMDGGRVDSQKSILAGVKVDFLLSHRLRPYADFLLGRGEMDYHPGYVFGNQFYLLTTTNVYSPGVGFDYDLSNHFSVRVDGQFQRWGYAPTQSGVVYSKVGTVALNYRFDFNRRGMR
jgi:hypothetical protein